VAGGLGTWTRWCCLAGALATLLGIIAPTALAADDEVSAAEDNPPGCTTATSEDQEQCGAQGRAHFMAETHVPPIDACNNITSPAGSIVRRILPEGPRRPDGTMAFVPGACVYEPPGYATSGLRYPVVYLLHGGGGDQANWVTQGDLQATLDVAAAAGHPIIAVSPDGRSGQWFDYYDGSFQLETYVLRHLIPYVDRHYNTIADRRGRAITGLSNGGYGALHFAAKAPDLFVAAGSMSGNVGARAMGGLGTPVGETGLQAQEAGAHYYGNVPISLVPNLDAVGLTIDWGATCASDITVDLCATYAFEQSFRLDNQALRDELDAQGHTNYEYRETEGSHAWRWWSTWFRDRHLPYFLDRLAAPKPLSTAGTITPPPDSFRYRSIAPQFSVWGYDVTVDRAVREFLDLTDVTASGLHVKGTGPVSIVTAGRYAPGASYAISGAGLDGQIAVADGTGRLTMAVDLGPSHQVEQYSPDARVQEAAGTYTFVERSVVIAAVTPSGSAS